MLDNQIHTRSSPSSIIDTLDALFKYIDAAPKYPCIIDGSINNSYQLDDYLDTFNEQHTIFNELSTTDQMNMKSSFSTIRSINSSEACSTSSLRNSNEISFNPMEWRIRDLLLRKSRPPKLDEFLHLLLNNLRYISYASWLNKAKGLFKIHKPTKVVELWRKIKNRKTRCNLNYEKFSRSIRYYYNKGIMIPTHRRYTYCFAVNKS
ncbi:unnamed protein product [Rotaria sordida]|uniref:ETS domain-containing protein n=1 Tax=Rotaria sordida TaxID=392033 RepID=A0A814A4F5_9BILA|nr:unnamed protein product [Rotaria sordida]CAF0910556.1 unnamed protein product [Rotaria sordida]CAF0924841.1 unnamed protein product [Rotaria sordida]CAF0926177.1 unnamed protein product [Rotaria sordida]CAF0937257.1 unnamed protein product [Rotaria sordida]